MNKFKLIISTFGPLHLVKSAEYLAEYVDLKVLQGWIPGKKSGWILRLVSKIIKRDITKTIRKRFPESLKGQNTPIALPEFLLRFGWQYLPVKNDTVSFWAAKLYGFMSKKHIHSADIFHVRSGSGMGGAIEKAKRKGMKVMVDHSIAHPAFMEKQLGSEFIKHKKHFEFGMDARFWQGVLSDCDKADCLLVNSNFVRDTFIENGYPANRIQVVYLGVREDFFQLKNDYAIKNKVKILFTGSFGFRKGAEYLLKALQELDKRNFDYEMIVVGSYDEASELFNTYNPDNIHFTGHIPQDELKKYLSESDIYLFPSLAEGCASSGMEAMAAGLPVITTVESGLPIENNKNGIIVTSKNVEEIVNMIIELAENENIRKNIGQNAAKTIIENYTWENYAKKVNDIYLHLLKN